MEQPYSLLTGTIFFSKQGETGRDGVGRGREGVGGGKGNFPLASVGSRAGGDNKKRAHSAQRRVGPEGPTDGRRPAPGSRVSASLPLCMRSFPKQLYFNSHFPI